MWSISQIICITAVVNATGVEVHPLRQHIFSEIGHAVYVTDKIPAPLAIQDLKSMQPFGVSTSKQTF